MRRSRAPLVLAIAAVLAGSPMPAYAQEGQAPAEDPIFANLYSPELIMQHRRAIGLTDEQRDAISRLIGDLQGRVVQLQWELLDEMRELGEITGAARVDLDRALDQMGNVLDIEDEIKRAHLEMLVRIKNLLSDEQKSTLESLRAAASSPGA